MVPSPWERRSCLRGMRQGGAVARSMSSGNQVLMGQKGATNKTCYSSSLTLHSVCSRRLTGGNTYLCEASCGPRVRTEGGLGQGVIQLAVGGVVGSKQVHLSFPESTPDQPDCLGMESPFSRERELSWEHVGCTIELPWNVDGTQRFEPRLTLEDEMAGELWHAAWS